MVDRHRILGRILGFTLAITSELGRAVIDRLLQTNQSRIEPIRASLDHTMCFVPGNLQCNEIGSQKLRTIKSVLGKAERLRADIGNYRDRLLQSMILTIVPPLFQSDMPLF
jgi:hypothetical protein